MPKTAKAKRKAKRKIRTNARPNHLSNLFNAMPKGPLRISQRVATPYPQVRCKTFRL